jgi:hypothetical protein
VDARFCRLPYTRQQWLKSGNRGTTVALDDLGDPLREFDILAMTRLADGVHWILPRPRELRSPIHLKENI